MTTITRNAGAVVVDASEIEDVEMRRGRLDRYNIGYLVLSGFAIIVFAVGLLDVQVVSLGALVLLTVIAGSGGLIAASSRLGPPAARNAWLLVAAGLFALAGGELTRLVWNSTIGGAVSAGPRLLSAALFYPLLTLGLLSLPYLRGSSFGLARSALDAVAAVTALSVLVWEFRLRDLFEAATSVGARFIVVMIPVFDLALVGAVIVVLIRRSPHRFDPARVALSLASLLFVAANAADPSFFEGAGREPGLRLDSLRLGAYACIGVAAWFLRRPPAEQKVALSRPRAWKLAVPFLLVGTLFGVFFWQVTLGPESASGLLSWGALIVAVLVVLRQVAATQESRDLMAVERDQLITSVSHELRVPLTAVSGFADVLGDGWDRLPAEEARDMLDIIRVQSHQLTSIVGDMAALARGQLDTVELRKERIDGKSLISDAIRAVFDVNKGPIPVQAKVEPYLEVIGDRARLTQVLVGLLKNAQRYGSGRIQIIARRTDRGREIEVHDDGPGVPSRHEELIWERFERGANTLNAQVPGSGLGLAVVRSLMKAHGGEAHYRRSERLGGACFWIELPHDPRFDR